MYVIMEKPEINLSENLEAKIKNKVKFNEEEMLNIIYGCCQAALELEQSKV